MMDKALSDKLGQEFEDFFSDFGGLLWGADFERWKPQGPLGDFKCDGYLISQRTVFQCYAPERLEAAKAETKISDSFDGAKNHFGKRMKKWCFVHNSRDGLHGTSNTLLGDLRDQNPNVEIEPWGPETIIGLSQSSPHVLEGLFPTILGGTNWDRTTEDALIAHVALIRERRKSEEPAHVISNQADLATILDQLANGDKDIRHRVLALCMWYEPISIDRVKKELTKLDHAEMSIQTNIDRLCEAELIFATAHHLLPLNTKVCEEAAEDLMDEFIARLD
jgi:hypothetical protein